MLDWTPGAPNRAGQPAGPRIGAVRTHSDGTISFDAGVLPGRVYRVEFTGALTAPWQPLGPDRQADGALFKVTEQTTAAQRFYRVQLIP